MKVPYKIIFVKSALKQLRFLNTDGGKLFIGISDKVGENGKREIFGNISKIFHAININLTY